MSSVYQVHDLVVMSELLKFGKNNKLCSRSVFVPLLNNEAVQGGAFFRVDSILIHDSRVSQVRVAGHDVRKGRQVAWIKPRAKRETRYLSARYNLPGFSADASERPEHRTRDAR